MALSPELEKRVEDLRLGVTSAPAAVVSNERSHLLDVLKAYDQLKAELEAKPKSEPKV